MLVEPSQNFIFPKTDAATEPVMRDFILLCFRKHGLITEIRDGGNVLGCPEYRLPLEITGLLLRTIGGGVLCGAVVALGALLLAGRTDDHLVEITFTTVAAYGSFLLADHFGLSGVLATITAGLVMGNFTSLGTISGRGKEAVQAFWEYAAFVANSFVFLLIGVHEARQNFRPIWLPAVIAIALVTLGRAVAIYPCCFLFSRSSLRVAMNHQHALWWGGLRGALALALALGLPPEVPQREEIITISFAVVAFSIFVQGLTMTPLLRALGEIRKDPRVNVV